MQSVFIDTATAMSSSSGDALAFLQRAARLLLEYNTRTELLRRRLREVAQVLGLKVQVAVGYRSITLYTPEGGYTHSQAPEFRINIAVSSVVHHIIDDVCAGRLLPAEACARLDDAERGAERHNRWILALIFGFGAAALAAFFRQGAPAFAHSPSAA